MPARPVEIATGDEIDEGRDGERRLGRQELDVERTAVGLQEHMRVRPTQGRRQPAARDIAVIGQRAAGRDRQDRPPGVARIGKRIGGEPPHQIVIGSWSHRDEPGRHAEAAGRGRRGDGAQRRDSRQAGIVERIALGAEVCGDQEIDVVDAGMAGDDIGRDAAHRGVGLGEQDAGVCEQRSVGRRHDALQRLQRLRDDPASRVGELCFQPVARARGGERLRGDAAPAPVCVATDSDRRRHSGAAVRLRQGDERLSFERKDAARKPGTQRLECRGAAQHAQRRLGLHSDADVAIGDERHDRSGESGITERRERTQRIDADMRVGVVEQPAQAGDCVARIEARAVDQRLTESSRRYGARLRVPIAECADQWRGARGCAQARERIEGAPPARGVGSVRETGQLCNRRALAEPPRFEQRGVHDCGRGGR